MRSLLGPLPTRVVLTVVLGCLVLGLFFGWNAGAAYRLTAYVLWEPLEGPRNFTIPDLGSTGGILGASGGLAVGLIWCRLMGRARGQSTPQRSTLRGALLGGGLGVLCTIWLHAGLIVALVMDSDRPHKELDMLPLVLGIGLACGAISGFILGEICTRVAGWFLNGGTRTRSRTGRVLLSVRSTLSIARMFARMVGRVPASHLLYLLRRMRFEKPHRFAAGIQNSRPLVQTRINTFFPPYPSPAFDRFCEAVVARRRVPYSVYLAATGACPFRCGHCSYAGREPEDMSGERMRSVIDQVKQLGTATLGFTGGEPLLRGDLEELVAAAGPEMVTIVFTTGHGLDRDRAERLAGAGVGCVTIGIEASDAAGHDAVRGCPGSFEEAAAAARVCREAGLYLAVSTIATRERLASGVLESMYDLGREWGAGEFRILSPVATGAWRGCGSLMLSSEERARLIAFHMEHNRRADGPAINTFAYLESDALFGCGAGYHHLFIDAAGNVCPCDLTPLSFGNVADEPLADIWERMGEHFPWPRCGCLMAEVGPQMPADARTLPLPSECSTALCRPPATNSPLPEGYRRLLRR